MGVDIMNAQQSPEATRYQVGDRPRATTNGWQVPLVLAWYGRCPASTSPDESQGFNDSQIPRTDAGEGQGGLGRNLRERYGKHNGGLT